MRKHWIDYLRVIAIIAVITIHSTTTFYSKFNEIGQLDWWLANLLNSASRFAVPLFVMISGAVLLGRDSTVGEFYKKRAIRLLPAFIVWNLFYLGLELVFSDMSDSALNFNLFIELFVNGGAAAHLWYLSMFICLMLFVPFLNMFINGEKPASPVLTLLLGLMFIFFILNGISNVTLNILEVEIEWFKYFSWYLAYFLGGYYLDKYTSYISLRTGFIIFFLATLILLGSTLNYYFMSFYKITEDNIVMISTGPIIFVITAIIFLLAKRYNLQLKENKYITIISEASFGMYLIHPVFLHLLKQKLPMYYSYALLYIPITIIVTTIASLYSIIFLRKLSFMRKVC